MIMKDRLAIVTGSTSGIGRVIALELARRGATILITSNESRRILDTLHEIRKEAPDSEAFEADITSQECLRELVRFAMKRFGRIDILVNNAGITRDNLLIRMKDAEWDQVIATNLTSVFRLTRLVLRPMMKARYGRIINIASVVGITGNPGQANYTAAKAGLMALTRTTALEVASRHITVNAVAPGFIDTPMTEALNSDAREVILARIPLGAMGKPEDVAFGVAFLASDQAHYITGETLNINGGMYMA